MPGQLRGPQWGLMADGSRHVCDRDTTQQAETCWKRCKPGHVSHLLPGCFLPQSSPGLQYEVMASATWMFDVVRYHQGASKAVTSSDHLSCQPLCILMNSCICLGSQRQCLLDSKVVVCCTSLGASPQQSSLMEFMELAPTAPYYTPTHSLWSCLGVAQAGCTSAAVLRTGCSAR